MAAVEFVNVARGDRLGPAGSYYRVVIERNSRTGGLLDKVWLDELRRFHETLAQSRVAFSASLPAATGKDDAAVFDVRSTREGESATVADLVNALEHALDRVGRNAAQVRSVERVARVSAAEREQVQQSAAASIDKDRAENDPLRALWNRVKSLGSVAYWLVVLLLVGGAAFLAWKAYLASKVASKVVA